MARVHYGVLTVDEALKVGLTRSAIHRRVEKGVFTRPLPGVLVVAGAPEVWEQRVAAAQAWLGDGWFCSHRCAGQIWLLDGIPRDRVEFCGPGGRRGRAGITLHKAPSLGPADVVSHRGFRVSSPSRTLSDLGSVLEPDEVEAAVESALRRGLTSVEYLSRFLERRRSPGRNGVGVLREVLERRPAGLPPTESLFETRLYQALRKARVRLPVRQHWVYDGEVRLGRVDFAYPDLKVVLEADSYANHSGRLDWESDIDRYNQLTSLGWLVQRITWRKLKESPSDVTARITHTLRQRELGLF